MVNPFPLYKYPGPAKFCDRNKELSTLLEAFNNKRSCALFAMRRLGKTGLIHHFQHHLNKKKKAITIYFDVLDTKSDNEFINKMVTACLRELDKKNENLFDRISKYFSKLKPVLTFDPFTGVPQIELDLADNKDIQLSLSILCEILGIQKQEIQISIDEFQQISNYDSTVIDASLRSYFHKMGNVHFVFSGSQRHLLLNLFSDSQKPLFGTVQHMHLKKMDPQVYASFINKHFTKAGKTLQLEDIDEILYWTRIHTFYTQFFCNRLFARNKKRYNKSDINHVKNEILLEYEMSFLSQRKLLSPNQWKLLIGIAKEDGISNFNSSFLQQYSLASSTARQSLEVMLEKEIVYETIKPEKSIYEVYDPFFSRWIEYHS